MGGGMTLKVGTTLSQVGLGIHLGRGSLWLRQQGDTLEVRGETWQAFRFRTGRLRGYKLLSRSSSPICAESAVQQASTAT